MGDAQGPPAADPDHAYRRFTVREALSEAECDRLIAAGVGLRPSAVQHDGPATAETEGARTSSCAELPHGADTDWLFARLHPKVQHLNQRWGFEITGYSAPQLLRYRPGEHYAWHVDLGAGELATRKLSLVVHLSGPEAHTGGTLEFMPDLGAYQARRGTLVVFPSFVPHRVTPVLTGERWVLVTWVHGDHRFR